METATLELELRVEELQRALEMADRAVSVAHVQATKEQEDRQRRIGTILAVVGAALTVPGIMDREVARGLLGLFPGLAPLGDSFLAHLVTQVLFVLIFALLAGLIVNHLGKRRER